MQLGNIRYYPPMKKVGGYYQGIIGKQGAIKLINALCKLILTLDAKM